MPQRSEVMTTLTIYTKTFTAVETYCGDDIKYVESFGSWYSLLNKLAGYFDSYAYVRVNFE